jgi:hypothetical protein
VGRRQLLARAVTAITISLGIAACGPRPSASPEGPTVAPAVDVALACWTVADAECRGIFEAALARLPVGRPPAVAARVMAYGCESGPCDPGVLARGQGQVQIEYVGGGGLISWELTLAGGGGLAFSPPTEAIGRASQPQSGRAAGQVANVSLGHCGLYSPIDFDGSFWDPIGSVDGDAPEAINSASGTIRLLGPQEAEFRAPSGFTVRLRRHPGAQVFQGCA